MLNKNYSDLNEKEKEIAINRLSAHIQVSKDIIKKIILKMNPVLSIIDNKTVIHKNTLSRIEKSIKKHLNQLS
ncbi:hypothetical protein [Aquimarina sediminis]|uniref:hypothetical protein n=1 Tax=Aquimarina sediminis TaxID=2070536 RepID=UPI000CA08FE9|nr:hypothetical protein [Aquimarina sediminis]